jgi:hypothetical protein
MATTKRINRPLTIKDMATTADRLRKSGHIRPFTVAEGGAGRNDLRRAARIISHLMPFVQEHRLSLPDYEWP